MDVDRVFMSTTPILPEWIRRAQVPGYTTAHELCPQETRLYGTESLYGDWSGKVLLLAKDFAPSRLIHERLAAGDPRPYRHEPSMRTNLRLQALAGPYAHLGLLYGSALTNLLRDDGQVSGSLPKGSRKTALRFGTRVLKEFVFPNMPHLSVVVCMGSEAWECACNALGEHGDWVHHRDEAQTLGKLVAAFHPAARVEWDRIQRPWRALQAA